MPKFILVVPVGKQGFTTVKVLLMGEHHVHFLARNPSSNAAKELQSLGAVLHIGDLSSQDALEGAMKGVEGVFFAVPSGGPDPEDEIRIGRNVIKAAQKTPLNISFSLQWHAQANTRRFLDGPIIIHWHGTG